MQRDNKNYLELLRDSLIKKVSILDKISEQNEIQLKLKEEKTIDLEVVDVEEGSGDFENALGALVCRSRDNKINVNVGTGLSMEQRGITFDLSSGKKVVKHLRSFDEVKKDFLGKIVEVKYNDIIKSKDKKEISLFLPRFIKIRDDKDQANSLEEI